MVSYLVEAEVFGYGCGRGHHFRNRAENLCRDRMFVIVEIQIVERPRGVASQPFRTGEFGHNQAARTERPNYAAENRVGDASHGRQNGRRANGGTANF
jgi:hypothetical protein